MEFENLITFNIEAIGSRKPIYTLFFENDKTINELYEQILYDLECEDDIILYFNNDKLEKANSKINKIFNAEEKEVRLDIVCKEYTEREILEIFYHVTNGPNWYINTNWLTDKPLSEWFGIKVHENSNNKFIVKGIYLGWNNLKGEIPKEIGKLMNLKELWLNSNKLTGEIPKEIAKLINLEELYLSTNKLIGEIPKEIGKLTNLQCLCLFSNQLSGEIPKEIGKLTNLQKLYLSNNQLTGEIPKVIGKLTNLKILSLYGTKLSREIPKEVKELKCYKEY